MYNEEPFLHFLVFMFTTINIKLQVIQDYSKTYDSNIRVFGFF